MLYLSGKIYKNLKAATICTKLILIEILLLQLNCLNDIWCLLTFNFTVFKMCFLLFLTCLLNNILVPNVQAKVNNLRLDRLTVKDGLSQGTLNFVFQDNEGLLWFATESGLNIYDGYRFRVLPGPTDGFSSNGVYKVIQDRQSLMWLITSEGLFSYNKKKDEYQYILSHAPESKDYYLIDIIESDDKALWIVSSKTLLKYDQQTGQYETVVDLSKELLDKERITKLVKFDRYIYLATRNGIYIVNIEDGQWKKLPSINKNELVKDPLIDRFYNLFISNEQQLYLGSYNGLYKIDVRNIDDFFTGKSELNNYELIDKNIESWVFYPTDKYLYIGDSSGLSKVDLFSGKSERLFAFNDVYDDINNNVVTSMHIDRQGIFWLGSNVSGIYKWDPKLSLINNIRYKKSEPNRLSDNVVWELEISKSNPDLLWVATDNGLNSINLMTGYVERFLVNTKNKNIYTESHIEQLQEDSKNRLWLLTAKGLTLFDTVTKKNLPLPFSAELNKYLSSEHYAIFIDDMDYLWSLTTSKFRRINLKNGEVDELKELELLVSDADIYGALGYLPDSQEMLISTNGSLLSFNIDTREVKLIYKHENVLKNEHAYINSWVIDKNNTLWLALSAKGLIGLDATTYQKKYFFNKKNAQIDYNIYGLTQDNDGDLWFSSHNGIYSLNSESHHFRNFNVDDGFSAREFNDNSFKNIKGKLFAYGSINGLSIFDPYQLKQKNYQNEIIVHATNVDVLSRKIKLPFILDADKEIQLEYDDVGIRFEFSALTYQNQALIFNYQLKGNSDVIYPDTEDNYITFPSLSSGKHILSVRVKSPHTGEFSKATELTLNISYPLWASPLAYFLYVAFGCSIFGVWLHRRSTQRKQLLIAHEEVKYRENRLQLALTGSNSEVWDWQANDNLIFGKRGAGELGYTDLTSSYHFTQHAELIHPDDKETFLLKWEEFILAGDINKNFSCTYRLKSAKGQWLWYKDLGKIVALSENGKPNRITGSYSNITETRASEDRALYYGDAFKQTKDWVLIISENFTRVTANKSLRDVFGWPDEEFKFSYDILGLNRERKRFYKEVLSVLKENEHWRGEELIQAQNGKEYHVIIKVNVSKNEATNDLHYVFIFTDITAQKTAEQELRYLANYDYLTNLPNRSLLLERIKHAMAYSERKKQSIALFFIDLDRFKQINDTLGHDYGDMLLKEITSRLANILRVDDTVARIGGDEFVILLESFKNTPQLGKIAQKIIHVIEQPVILNGNSVSVGASIGIALYPDDAKNSDELLRSADVAMYHAKQIGRNTFQFFTPRMNFEASARLKTESNLQSAHKNNEFINHYQPIVDANKGKAKGVELLMRWQTKDGLIPPLSFIPVAEELGLIIAMTESALDRGLADLKIWRKIRADIFLSVNLSPQHFAKESLVPYITKLLAENKLPANSLKLEVTESALISQPDKAIKTMLALSKLGVSLALDDFGTGYSSLSYLKNLPLDVIKIDRIFVSGIGEDTADEAIVDATIVLARNLNMRCIAEGVETKAQLDYLVERGCNYIQGYLYSKPVDANKITEMLERNSTELLAL
ncbi:MAG: diguanylate cyclase (GGDEF)-like protein/PAS domain S-box-containing protein [Alteromonadaceae bacterium]